MGVQLRGNTVKTTGSANLSAHVLSKKDNEQIPEILFGSADFFENAAFMSEVANHKNAFYHMQLTFSEAVSREDVMKAFENIRSELDPKNQHQSILIEHVKARFENKGFDKHYHAVIAMTSEAGKSLTVSSNYARHEKIARICEVELGLSITKGRNNRAVIADLARTRPGIADTLLAAGIAEGMPAARARFGSREKEAAKRSGVDMSELKSAFARISETASVAEKAAIVSKIIAERDLKIEDGQKKGVKIITKNGNFVVAFNRISGFRAKEARKIQEEIEKLGITKLGITNNGENQNVIIEKDRNNSDRDESRIRVAKASDSRSDRKARNERDLARSSRRSADASTSSNSTSSRNDRKTNIENRKSAVADIRILAANLRSIKAKALKSRRDAVAKLFMMNHRYELDHIATAQDPEFLDITQMSPEAFLDAMSRKAKSKYRM